MTLQQIGEGLQWVRQAWHPEQPPVYRAGSSLDRVDFSPEAPVQYGLYERADDVSSCAYFYLDQPESGLPPLPAISERTADLP